MIDFELLFPRSTRSSANLFSPVPGTRCDCNVCDLARMKLDYPAWHKQHSKPAGKPPKENVPPAPPANIVKDNSEEM